MILMCEQYPGVAWSLTLYSHQTQLVCLHSSSLHSGLFAEAIVSQEPLQIPAGLQVGIRVQCLLLPNSAFSNREAHCEQSGILVSNAIRHSTDSLV